jgi:ppGpp synthetase/RelA/SpoT-type nucleotidyltranferase
VGRPRAGDREGRERLSAAFAVPPETISCVNEDAGELFRYQCAPLGTNALKRLGAAIAEGSQLDAGQQELYQGFIADADRRRVLVQRVVDLLLAQAADILPRTSVTASGRTKTLKTLREKLVRSPNEKLPSIRDVAGVRIVADCSTLEQAVIAQLLKKSMTEGDLFKDLGFTATPQVVDRLASPMHGYRAIHLVPRLDSAPVEIQIRTALQHSWAALMELLCDRWGRQPRYGEPLEEPDPEVRALKQNVLSEMQRLSKEIAQHEELAAPYGIASINFDWAEPIGGLTVEQINAIREEHPRIEPALTAAQEDMRESLSRLQDAVSEIEHRTRKEQT